MNVQHRREEDFYHWLFGLKNSSGEVYEHVDVVEYVDGNPDASEGGNCILVQDPETFTYDGDHRSRGTGGIFLTDERWKYTWDADAARQCGDGAPGGACPQGCFFRVPCGRKKQQNRLIEMEETRGPTAPAIRSISRFAN